MGNFKMKHREVSRLAFENFPSQAKNLFSFLIDRGFSITEENLNAAFILYYQKNAIRVILNYDFRDNFFYFCVVYGESTTYPNDEDNVNIKTFRDLFKSCGELIDRGSIQPNENSYLSALKKNASLLKNNYDQIVLDGFERQ